LNTNDNHFQNEIASHIGKLLRDAFGKGPQSIYVSINHPFVVIYLRNFMTPTEKILLKKGQVESIQKTREFVMETVIPEIKAYLLLLNGMDIQEFYYDWELHNHSGVFIGLQSEDRTGGSGLQEMYEGKEELHREFDEVSRRVQRSPDRIDSWMINKRTLLVVRSGILIDISKEVMRLGYEKQLKQVVSNLEKKYLRNNLHFQTILNTSIVDVFTDWDFHRDRSVSVFILHPKA